MFLEAGKDSGDWVNEAGNTGDLRSIPSTLRGIALQAGASTLDWSPPASVPPGSGPFSDLFQRTGPGLVALNTPAVPPESFVDPYGSGWVMTGQPSPFVPAQINTAFDAVQWIQPVTEISLAALPIAGFDDEAQFTFTISNDLAPAAPQVLFIGLGGADPGNTYPFFQVEVLPGGTTNVYALTSEDGQPDIIEGFTSQPTVASTTITVAWRRATNKRAIKIGNAPVFSVVGATPITQLTFPFFSAAGLDLPNLGNWRMLDIAGTPVATVFPVVLLYDSFTDAAATLLTAHTPDISPDGLPWVRKRSTVSAVGQYRIKSNQQAYLPVADWTSARLIYTKDVGISDVKISGRLRIIGSGESHLAGALDIRATDANNRFYAGVRYSAGVSSLRIASITSGFETIIASVNVGVDLRLRSIANDGLDISFRGQGTTLTLDVDEFTLSTTSALRLTDTNVGFGGPSGQGNQTLDDIEVTGL